MSLRVLCASKTKQSIVGIGFASTVPVELYMLIYGLHENWARDSMEAITTKACPAPKSSADGDRGSLGLQSLMPVGTNEGAQMSNGALFTIMTRMEARLDRFEARQKKMEEMIEKLCLKLL
jgi:hypothetical protein